MVGVVRKGSCVLKIVGVLRKVGNVLRKVCVEEGG